MGTVRYTVLDGEVISERRNGVLHDYMVDPLGSTIGLVDSTQSVTDTFAYSPFGEVVSRTGTTATPFQYVGSQGYYKDSSSRSYVRARTLNVNLGRWMTQDPIGFYGGDYNLFRYAFDSPLVYIDPSGQLSDNFGRSPDCSTVLDCLNSPNRKRCEKSNGALGKDNSLFLCISQQETSFLFKPNKDKPGSGARGGIANLTPPAFDQLIEEGCSWLKKFKDYEDFATTATDCEKAQAAQDYLGSRYISKKGLARFGPPYPSNMVTKLRNCAKDMASTYNQCGYLGVPPTDPVMKDSLNEACKDILRHKIHPD